MTRVINLRGIPDDLFKKFRKQCIDNDTDMTTAMKGLMELYAADPTVQQHVTKVADAQELCKGRSRG